MKNSALWKYSLVVYCLFTAALGLAGEAGWQESDESDGVKIFRKEFPDSSIIAFRGSTVIDGSIAKIAGVLDDSSRRKEWVDRVLEAYLIKRLGPLERLEYNHTKGNLLFQGRDFVFTASTEVNRPGKELWIKIKSVPKDIEGFAPRDGITRGELIDSEYYLKSIDDSKTFVQVQIMADPKGNIPKWLVNMLQESWPVKTLNGIRAQVKKPDVNDLQLLKTYLGAKDGPDFLTKDSIKGSRFETLEAEQKKAAP